ncbi:uncharacterized mitochondrial protein AtMg00310-like [Vicia villosa]|uniref:uncharacterized mitochondrial protein AtMg00310-like n=1 Tax=Vicia villosa TaxID=3911 RepID=UPI00273A7ADD|nr:uncharacterized mitochondrial protein AtMg00310-like [Vicia villosa]
MSNNILLSIVEEKRCIHWVSWDDVCLPVDKGGLGLKKLEVFNLALLDKWKWRIFEDSNSIWYRMLKARYGDIKLQMMVEGGKHDNYSSKFVWWADILSLEKRVFGDFFANNCSFGIGDGYSTSFWHSLWMKEGIIKSLFPSLFTISSLQDVSVACMGARDEGE